MWEMNLLTDALTFVTCVTGAERIPGRHKDIKFQYFVME